MLDVGYLEEECDCICRLTTLQLPFIFALLFLSFSTTRFPGATADPQEVQYL